MPPVSSPVVPPKFGYPNPQGTLADGVGNKAIALKNCRDVTLRDFSILHGGHFGILATGVDHLAIDHLKIDTNRDGMDIDACRDVHVSDCSVNSPWDDAICLKSSDGLGSPRDTEDVTITGCCVYGDYQEGTMLDGTWKHSTGKDKLPRTGRLKFGTESTGGFRRIAITNCVFDHCNGLAIESVDGGVIEDVSISNLVMHEITTSPIFIRLGARLRGSEGTAVGAIRRVAISNVTFSGANGRYGSILSGVPGHPLEDVLISNVRGVQGGGGTEQSRQRQPPELAAHYPEPQMFGEMPSLGLLCPPCDRADRPRRELAVRKTRCASVRGARRRGSIAVFRSGNSGARAREGSVRLPGCQRRSCPPVREYAGPDIQCRAGWFSLMSRS